MISSGGNTGEQSRDTMAERMTDLSQANIEQRAVPLDSTGRPADSEIQPTDPGELSAYPESLDKKQRRFLDMFETCRNVAKSATVAGVHRNTHYYWAKTNADYREAFKIADERATDVLEAEAWRRAVDGYDCDYVNKQGEVVSVRRYSDSLLALLLKGRRPIYGTQRVEGTVDHTIRVGKTIEIIDRRDLEARRLALETSNSVDNEH